MLLSDIMKGIEYSGFQGDCEVSDITSDSRRASAGVVFVCIKGLSVDGHDFAADALGNGAPVVVCERDLGLDNQIIVGSTHAALSTMCENFFGNPLSKLKLIGITGTNGKTSSTHPHNKAGA